MMIEQKGKNCLITTSEGNTHLIKNCDALKLANTIWDKSGDKYTNEEMKEFGFALKKGLQDFTQIVIE